MSWVNQLLKTYERNIKAQKQEEMQIEMTPVAHMNANVQLEIMLNEKGEFISASEIEKHKMLTLIPVTEQSSGRSSGIAPHVLSDTLSYIAGDFGKYCENKKQKKNADEKYSAYMKQLKAWTESEYATPKVEIIYGYLSKKRLIADLIECEIIELKDNGTFEDKKINGQPYEKVMVRFSVVFKNDDIVEETWKDDTLIDAYTNYYLSQQLGKSDICYVMGKNRMISQNHPKGIIASDYGAKLVSANDGQGYTFRGRFQDSNEAYALSYEASQKIHSALTWLVKAQGIYVGKKDKRVFVCWNPDGKKFPDIFDAFGEEDDDDNVEFKSKNRNSFKKMFDGYRENLDETDEAIIMGLDAATTGRLSITYYYKLMASDLLNRMIYWAETCNWFYLKFDIQNKPHYKIETPIFERIVKCAFGRENKDKMGKETIEVDDKVLKEQIQRLVKCMLEKNPVPFDIMQSLVMRASTPLAYSRKNREIVLSTACAVIVKYYYDRRKERKEDFMKLDTQNRDRSYLFGRLLAVYEHAERVTYDRDEQRETNAIRFQSVYVNHPMQTWKILKDALNPYYQKMIPSWRVYYEKLIDEIVLLFKDDDYSQMNQPLKETYLLGYYLQRAELYKKKEKSKEDATNE